MVPNNDLDGSIQVTVANGFNIQLSFVPHRMEIVSYNIGLVYFDPVGLVRKGANEVI